MNLAAIKIGVQSGVLVWMCFGSILEKKKCIKRGIRNSMQWRLNSAYSCFDKSTFWSLF